MKYKINLQLFAKSSTNSTTQSSSQGGQDTSSHESSVGGSSTHKEGGSNTHTEGQSITQSHSEGGSHALSAGKQYASGDVEDKTQAYRDAYNTYYEEGQKVQDAYQRLQDTIDKKPSFQSAYDNKLSELYDSIMNREKFNYNFNADPMYQMYKDNYTQQGKQAMQNTMGQAAAMTGGYGSSYSQTAGQQAYQDFLTRVNDMIPELRNQAYQQYRDEGNDLLNKYNVTNDAYNREYGQYRDEVNDWQNDRSFNYGLYSDERNFDYNQFAQERNYWNQEYWNERNSAWSNEQETNENNWNDSISQTDYWEDSQTRYWEDTVSSYWGETDSSSHMTNWNNSLSNTMSNTMSGGGGGNSASANARAQQTLAERLKSSASYVEPTYQDRANTLEEMRARYGSTYSNGEAVANDGTKDLKVSNFSKYSPLKNDTTREEVMSTLMNAQSGQVDAKLTDIAEEYNLNKNDVTMLQYWLQKVRGK